MSTTNTNERFERYRAQGWWPGERLEARYRNVVRQRPASLAVADTAGRELTHAELWHRAGELADLLASAGIASGDVVLLYLPNRVEWQIAVLAVLRLQALPASIPDKTEAKTLVYAAGLVGCKLLLTSACDRGPVLLEAAAAAADELADGLNVLCVAADAQHYWLSRAAGERPPSDSALELDHLMFTSSTTGLPKAVMHTADTLAALNILFAQRFSLDAEQPIFMCSPLGHSVGSIHGARLALYTGAPLILQETWDPSIALQLIERYRCAFTAAATPFLKDLIDEQSASKASHRASLGTFLCGGAPVPPALLEHAWQAFPDTFFTNLWGMTEGGVVTCVPDSPRDKLIETAGIGLPGLELRILAEDGTVLDYGHEGELAMRGPGVFVGYYGQHALYESLLTPDSFFRSGDLARLDADGYVRITGRIKDLIIRGGVNISPLPAEDVLSTHPHLESVAIVGFPDERLGERICAVVVPKHGRPSLDELIAYASREGLPKRQLPEVVRYIESMPRTAAGKIRKSDLVALIDRAGPDRLDLGIIDADQE
ncbi:MAG: AMP-binding protein [Gammaproteobacteria bacterium]|nr:AMP-binding protein [Gammaproteobacteria bacterium]